MSNNLLHVEVTVMDINGSASPMVSTKRADGSWRYYYGMKRQDRELFLKRGVAMVTKHFENLKGDTDG